MMDTIESQLKKYRACMAVFDRCASDTDCETCDLNVPDDQFRLFRKLDALINGGRSEVG